MAPQAEFQMAAEYERWVIGNCDKKFEEHTEFVENTMLETGDGVIAGLAEMKQKTMAIGKLGLFLKEHRRMKGECFKGVQPAMPKNQTVHSPFVTKQLAIRQVGTFMHQKRLHRYHKKIMKTPTILANICSFLDPLQDVFYNVHMLKRAAISMKKRDLLEPIAKSILNWTFRELSDMSTELVPRRYVYINIVKKGASQITLDLHFAPAAFVTPHHTNVGNNTNAKVTVGGTVIAKKRDSVASVHTPGKPTAKSGTAAAEAAKANENNSELPMIGANSIITSFELPYWRSDDVDAMERHIPNWKQSQFIKPITNCLVEFGYGNIYSMCDQHTNRIIIDLETA